MAKRLKVVTSLINVKNATLYADKWVGDGTYTQPLDIEVTSNSKIDIQLSIDVVNEINGKFTLVVKNDNCSVSVYAVGERPSIDIPVQLTITKVVREHDYDAVWGDIV